MSEPSPPRLVLVAGSTDSARIEGISAAGADPELMAHTPAADAEIVTYGRPVRAPVVPVSPTGCPTPAAVTRACRSLAGFDTTVVDGGLAKPTGAPSVSVGASRGRDVRERDPVPCAPGAFAAARQFGAALPDRELVLGETIPGGTTTALGVLRALGEDWPVSSSLPENPVALKEEVVREGLEASVLTVGDCAGEPTRALRRMGDPVLAVVAGIAVGALASGTRVVLGGGTQLLAAAALVRHAGVDAPLSLATTPYLARDVPALPGACGALDVGLTVTDPGFDGFAPAAAEGGPDGSGRDQADDGPAEPDVPDVPPDPHEPDYPHDPHDPNDPDTAGGPLARFAVGEAKEGAGMGGALLLADRAGVLDGVAATTLEVVRDLRG